MTSECALTQAEPVFGFCGALVLAVLQLGVRWRWVGPLLGQWPDSAVEMRSMTWENWLCSTGVSPVGTCIQNPRPGRPCYERSGFVVVGKSPRHRNRGSAWLQAALAV